MVAGLWLVGGAFMNQLDVNITGQLCQPQTALLLIAHGSRNSGANDDLRYVAEQMSQRKLVEIVETGYLELATPTIAEAAQKCVFAGARCVLMVPYFLSAGVHVRQDLAAMRQRLAQKFWHVEFRLGEPLGRHPLLLDIVADRVVELTGAASSTF
jgi:sirohydrochlorin ferrochelatase